MHKLCENKVYLGAAVVSNNVEGWYFLYRYAGTVFLQHTNEEKISVCFFGILAVGGNTLSYIEIPGQANGITNPRKLR